MKDITPGKGGRNERAREGQKGRKSIPKRKDGREKEGGDKGEQGMEKTEQRRRINPPLAGDQSGHRGEVGKLFPGARWGLRGTSCPQPQA